MDEIKAKYISDYSPKTYKNPKRAEKNVVEFLLLDPDRKPLRGRRK